MQLIEFLKGLASQDTLGEWTSQMGVWFYVLVFAVVFCETGLVVLPFLPGDSLLFAIGAVCAGDTSDLDFWTVAALLTVASVIGDAVNYAIGARLGPRVFTSSTSKLLNKKHLVRAQEFYERYGGKAIILARFVPIVRTFAPFVAGIGRMSYRRFAFFNVIGGLAWVLICLGAGWQFGRTELVRNHFEAVIVVIVLISVLPVAFEIVRARMVARARRASA
jgi:membrane-associated protein